MQIQKPQLKRFPKACFENDKRFKFPQFLLRLSNGFLDLSTVISSLYSLNWSQDGTESQAAVVAVWPAVVTVGRTTIPATADPTPPSMHPASPCIWTPRVSHVPTRKGSRIPIQAPLPDVPMHVIQTPSIRSIGNQPWWWLLNSALSRHHHTEPHKN